VDLADHRLLRPAAPGPAAGRRPAPSLGTARAAGAADPGPGPPGVPEHPREGRLSSRCAETRQARPGQAARIKEPPPCAPPRRGENDEERTDAQGTTRTSRLNGKLSHLIHTYARYVRFIRFSFLILIGCFVTLEGMKIKSVTPMHHPMSMGSSADCRLPSRCRA